MATWAIPRCMVLAPDRWRPERRFSLPHQLGLSGASERERLNLEYRASSACSVSLTSLSRLVAHSRESRGDLEMEEALVCMMGLKDHTLMTPSTSKLATLLPEQSTL